MYELASPNSSKLYPTISVSEWVHAIPGGCRLSVPSSLSDEAVDDDDEECAVTSLSLVLLSSRRRDLRLATASRFCLSRRILSLCLWLRLPRSRVRPPFACLSWQRFFLAAMATLADASLSDRERRDDFLGPGSECEEVAGLESANSTSPSSAEERVSESPR